MSDAYPTAPPPIVRVVLLGYMCSGKSTVGEALARRLEWRFVDFDVEIERREGTTVRDLIAAVGEEGFREREAALTDEVSTDAFLVIAPGGGWIMQPELLDALGPDTLSVWLRVSPPETVRRLMADDIERPFRDLADPTPRVAEMLAEREPLYRLADLSIVSDARSPEHIAFEIEQVVRTRGCSLPR